jgi:hypothetical protein
LWVFVSVKIRQEFFKIKRGCATTFYEILFTPKEIVKPSEMRHCNVGQVLSDVSKGRTAFAFKVKRHIPADLNLQPHRQALTVITAFLKALSKVFAQNNRMYQGADHLLRTVLIAIFRRVALPPLDRHAGIHCRRAVGETPRRLTQLLQPIHDGLTIDSLKRRRGRTT